jgi:hypothetical protein
MRSLPIIDTSESPSSIETIPIAALASPAARPPYAGSAPRRLPDWLKRALPRGNGNSFTHDLLRELRL